MGTGLAEPGHPKEQVPDEFVALVRDALVRLYDHVHLERHPLRRLVPAEGADPGLGGGLRELLLDAMDELRVYGVDTSDDPASRPHVIFARRYQDGLDVEEIRDELHISLRQYQREHRKGLSAISSVLWRRWRLIANDSERQGVGMSVQETGTVSDEVAWLGVEPQEILLSALVEEAVKTVRVLATERQVDLRTHPGPAPVLVWADPTLAKQALLGALNAVIAGQPQTVDLAWRAEADQAVLELALMTPGQEIAIDTAHFADRLRPASRLIEAQAGRLETLYREDRLVGISLSLPRVVRPLVLVVDDNPSLLRLFERFLSSDRLRFKGVTGAVKATEAMRAERPDLVVLDIMMRDVDGWRLLQDTRAEPRTADIPVIVCSVMDDEELAYALGAQGFLKKPVTRSALLEEIWGALGGSNPEATRPRER